MHTVVFTETIYLLHREYKLDNFLIIEHEVLAACKSKKLAIRELKDFIRRYGLKTLTVEEEKSILTFNKLSGTKRGKRVIRETSHSDEGGEFFIERVELVEKIEERNEN